MAPKQSLLTLYSMKRKRKPEMQICRLGSLWPRSNVQQPHGQEKKKREAGGKTTQQPQAGTDRSNAIARKKNKKKGWQRNRCKEEQEKGQTPDLMVNSMQQSKCGRIAPNWQNTIELKWLKTTKAKPKVHLARSDSL